MDLGDLERQSEFSGVRLDPGSLVLAQSVAAGLHLNEEQIASSGICVPGLTAVAPSHEVWPAQVPLPVVRGKEAQNVFHSARSEDLDEKASSRLIGFAV